MQSALNPPANVSFRCPDERIHNLLALKICYLAHGTLMLKLA
jgi:hypothetical protein